jgi:hypothetical protein
MFALVLAIVPRLAFPPAMPLTSQVIAVPGATQNDAVKFSVCPNATLAVAGEIEFVLGQMIVALALPDLVPSATLVAVTLTVAGEGGAGGAVYIAVAAPFATTVPSIAFPPEIPFTLQVTPVAGLPDPLTLAVNTCAPPTSTFTGLGLTLTTMSSFSVTLADALACGSALLTASTVTVAGDGKTAGAVYSPPAEIVPVLALPPVTSFTSHVTLVFVVPATLA